MATMVCEQCGEGRVTCEAVVFINSGQVSTPDDSDKEYFCLDCGEEVGIVPAPLYRNYTVQARVIMYVDATTPTEARTEAEFILGDVVSDWRDVEVSE
jgi:hypothetical protein